MKKFISLCLAILMIFALLPVSAFAESDSFESYDYQIALAKQIFPEYRDKLEGKTSAYASKPRTRSEEIHVAIQKTRPVDDDTVMTYTEYDNGLVTLGTAVLASYLICQRLPALRSRLSASGAWQDRWRPALSRLLTTLRQWVKAQLKLSSVTFAIVLGGFLLLGVRQKLLMALVTALVDAVPLLGTGTILLPWTLVSLLSGEPVRAVGLLGIYVTALITRSALEPKLLGRQLGLDPLAALAALYIGYRIWGFGGMILAPILTVTARELCRSNS